MSLNTYILWRKCGAFLEKIKKIQYFLGKIIKLQRNVFVIITVRYVQMADFGYPIGITTPLSIFTQP